MYIKASVSKSETDYLRTATGITYWRVVPVKKLCNKGRQMLFKNLEIEKLFTFIR